jgi:hypothetical protein
MIDYAETQVLKPATYGNNDIQEEDGDDDGESKNRDNKKIQFNAEMGTIKRNN